MSGKTPGLKPLLTTVAASAAALVYVMSAQAADLTVRIMTQNVYQGTNFDAVLAAMSTGAFVAAVTTTYDKRPG